MLKVGGGWGVGFEFEEFGNDWRFQFGSFGYSNWRNWSFNLEFWSFQLEV